jgi:hypothetical protein
MQVRHYPRHEQKPLVHHFYGPLRPFLSENKKKAANVDVVALHCLWKDSTKTHPHKDHRVLLAPVLQSDLFGKKRVITQRMGKPQKTLQPTHGNQ